MKFYDYEQINQDLLLMFPHESANFAFNRNLTSTILPSEMVDLFHGDIPPDFKVVHEHFEKFFAFPNPDQDPDPRVNHVTFYGYDLEEYKAVKIGVIDFGPQHMAYDGMRDEQMCDLLYRSKFSKMYGLTNVGKKFCFFRRPALT